MQAIANLSVNASVAKAVAEEGGIDILAGLARSMNRQVAEEAAGGLWNLSVGEEHKVAYFCRSFYQKAHDLKVIQISNIIFRAQLLRLAE